jgi:hypothetical protein
MSDACPNSANARHGFKYAGRAPTIDGTCECPFFLTCLCGHRIVSRCNRAARSRCGPCSETYRRRVRRVFESGFTDRPTDRILLVTITAPGDREHFTKNGEPCRCTPPDGINIAEFNALASKGFNRWMQDMRRQYGGIQYGRAAEIQDGKRRKDGDGRGALHFHVLIRADRPDQILRDFRAKDPDCPMRIMVEHHGFGHALDVQIVAVSTAGYCAKYVSKSADEREEMPWLDLVTGELVHGNGRYRTWTASREWGLTMKAIRAAQAAWVRERLASEGDGPGGEPKAAARAGAAEGDALDLNTQSYTTEQEQT